MVVGVRGVYGYRAYSIVEMEHCSHATLYCHKVKPHRSLSAFSTGVSWDSKKEKTLKFFLRPSHVNNLASNVGYSNTVENSCNGGLKSRCNSKQISLLVPTLYKRTSTVNNHSFFFCLSTSNDKSDNS